MNLRLTVLIVFLLACTSQAYAHGGGVDSNGCHSKNQVRHCHGANAGKYIPEKESSRVAKVHTVACNSPDGEGRYPKKDLYGKRCNQR
ncbi:MAG: hypothetical protein ABL903_19805 [Methylococcales bacterium]